MNAVENVEIRSDLQEDLQRDNFRRNWHKVTDPILAHEERLLEVLRLQLEVHRKDLFPVNLPVL